MNDSEFIDAFEKCALPNHSFHHADHVRMAFLYLQKYAPLEALDRFSKALTRFAIVNGQPNLYNETITWAFLLLIRERVARAEAPQTWPEFSESNGDLLRWKDNVLKKYYRPETLSSELAKKVFLFPDNIPPRPDSGAA